MPTENAVRSLAATNLTNRHEGVPISAFLLGDADQNGVVDFLDIAPFISILSSGTYLGQADCNQDGFVDFLDIPIFISILANS